ncbi:MAG: M23 family metallopeptidase [Candidatus Puniceispirillales bacterium]
MRRAYVFLVFTLMAAGLSAAANALEIKRGKPIQGGLVLLSAAPGASLTANGEPLMLNAEGLAIIGFHRDETDPVTITETDADGQTSSITLTPEKREYLEQRIDGLPKKMVTPPEEVLVRIGRDRENVIAARSHATAISAFAGPIIWPVEGIITGVYGSRRVLNGEPRAPHYGIDIAAPKGTPVKAPADGIIRMADDLYFTGWTIILDHGHGMSSTFLHLETTAVEVGDSVSQGQVIGTVGSTGRSTGPHLDWRINVFGKRLDPMLIAGPMPQ